MALETFTLLSSSALLFPSLSVLQVRSWTSDEVWDAFTRPQGAHRSPFEAMPALKHLKLEQYSEEEVNSETSSDEEADSSSDEMDEADSPSSSGALAQQLEQTATWPALFSDETLPQLEGLSLTLPSDHLTAALFDALLPGAHTPSLELTLSSLNATASRKTGEAVAETLASATVEALTLTVQGYDEGLGDAVQSILQAVPDLVDLHFDLDHKERKQDCSALYVESILNLLPPGLKTFTYAWGNGPTDEEEARRDKVDMFFDPECAYNAAMDHGSVDRDWLEEIAHEIYLWISGKQETQAPNLQRLCIDVAAYYGGGLNLEDDDDLVELCEEHGIEIVPA